MSALALSLTENQEPVKPNVYIYIDTTAKDYQEARRSKVIVSEFSVPYGKSFLDDERKFIYDNYSINIVEVNTLAHLPEAKRFPCIKFGKNGVCEYFAVGTFESQGTFITRLYENLCWILFEKQLYEYKLKDNHLYFDIDKLIDYLKTGVDTTKPTGEDLESLEFYPPFFSQEEALEHLRKDPNFPKVTIYPNRPLEKE